VGSFVHMRRSDCRSPLKHQENKGKFVCRISSFKRTKLHQNSFKSLVKPTISLNLLVLSLILYKCLNFFNSILMFERIKYKFNKNASCSLIVAMLQHSGCDSGRHWRYVFCKPKRFRFYTKMFKISK
jgi:hypothetical protein